MPDEDQTRAQFETFTASSDWRALPLQIKLWVFRLWRAERDTPAKAEDSPAPRE